ncbi:serine protease [Falsihalocynthiibacter sp. SS001]|uniref:serine protease n=1 Tax=Falsihalocynthiibacter sp. SS001 TaxID=3349698 RepID=UPI0036D3CE8B
MLQARHSVPATLLTLILSLSFFFSSPAIAQTPQDTWIQIEAHPSLNEAQTRSRAYSGAFDNVGGFRSNSGWYVIALGPYTEAQATRELNRLLSENLIPRDSYLAQSRVYTQQFWPFGGTSLTDPTPTVQDDSSPLQPTEPVGELINIPDETPAQARASERALSRTEKMALQEALKWEGFYSSAIDGAFGRGTRSAMGEYQAAKGYDVTGILTTKQRTELINKFNEVFTKAGMAPYNDSKAGIAIRLPLDLVEFDKYDAPFVHFKPQGDSKVSVSLISQKGDQATLFGLYEIMQTLEIVPLNGQRERKENSFELRGNNDEINSYTFAQLTDGAIKGFTLVWPAGDRGNMNRIVDAMKSSFTSLGTVALDDLAGADQGEQRIDLLSGLEIRKPEISRSGFYLDGNGTVLTTSEVVGSCDKLTLDNTYPAELVFADKDLGLAVLRPTEKLAPLGYANFVASEPRLNSEVAVAGYSYEGALDAPTLTFGTLADVRGLGGEQNMQRLELTTLAGDAGGPVVNSGGAVIGMLRTPEGNGDRKLPENVSFASSASAITAALNANGVTLSTSDATEALHPVDLSARASDMTVLVSCWK